MTVWGTIHSPYRRIPGKSFRSLTIPSFDLANTAKGSGGRMTLLRLMVQTSPSSV